MDSNNWRPTQADQPPPVEAAGDWRAQFQPDSRQKIVNKIMETLRRHLPCTGQDGLMELKKIAARFEEKIYTSATSQTDYLRKISVKMLTMESKSQNTAPNAMPSNSVGGSRNPSDPAASSQSMQPQVHDPSQSVPAQMISNQSQAARQQLVAQNNMQNSIASSGVQTSVNPLPPVSGLTQNPTPNVAQNLNISGIPQNSMANNMNQGVSSSMFANVQRQMQARQLGMQQPPQQSQNQFMYQQQLQHHQMLKQKMQHGNIQQMLQTPMQQQQTPQQQNNLLQATQLQTSQQAMMQTSSSAMQPSMMSGMQQNQQSALQQQHQQSVLRQQQQTPVVQQQPMMPSQQQQLLMGQRPNAVNAQQNSLIGQQNSVPNNSQNLQQQQQLMGQQNSNISNMNAQQLGHQNHTQQQQLMGPQSGSTSMQQTNQHSVHMMQQTKGPVQQQPQNVTSLLTGGQQQLMSQPAQLQQHLGMQQQSNSFQQNMQQRIQTQSPLLQHQNVIDQQKQLFQQQRVPTDGPSTSLDSTAQTGSASAGDWQEEVSQKIKVMKDLYFADLNEICQKVSTKLQQHDSLPQPPKSEQLEKLRAFKHMIERFLQILQTTKANVLPIHRDKLSSVEKQIISLLNSHRPRKPMPPMQQGQIQLPQTPSHDSGPKPQLQSRNLQGAVPTMQHGSMPSLSAIGSSQQSANLDSGSGTAPSSMQQQVAMGSMQQNPVSTQANINPLQQASGGNNMLQQNINPLQPNANLLQSQHLKQQLQNRHIQQQLLQKQQQQQQRLQLQAAKQQQMQTAHQMPQMQDVNDLKMRQGLGLRSGAALPSHLSSVQQRYAHQQLKPGAPLPVSSPQLGSPQINQHSSPQIEQQNVPQTVRTPLQSANSPFAPSPSTPMAPSPMPGDPEKPVVTSLSNAAAANVGQQQTNAAAPGSPQSLAIRTPGISASLFLEAGATDGAQGNSSMGLSGKSSITEQPLERLLKAVKSMSSKALAASVSEIGSVVNMVDCNAGSAPGTGSRATVGEDLVTMTKCRLQARNFHIQDGTIGNKRVRRSISATPLIVGASAGSMNEQLTGYETSELESTATSSIKKPRIEVNQRLLEEIREINECLIDTYVDISDEDADLPVSSAVGSNGTVVRCCFNAVSLSPSLKSLYTSAHMSPIQPLRMLVPSNYPNCSPIFLEKLPVKDSKEQEDLSVKAKTRFSTALRCLSQPMSLKDMIRTWDDCARAVISEYAQQNGGGGTFTSNYGAWENCPGSP